MIYLIYGNNQDLIVNKRIQNSLKENLSEINDFNVTYYDYDESSMREIIDDCLTMPMLDESKGIVVKNFSCLCPSKSFKQEDQNILLEYLNNPVNSTTLIFVVPGNIDDKKVSVKKLKEVARIIKLEDISKDDWQTAIERMLVSAEIEIDNNAKSEFISRTEGDLNRVTGEIAKLKNLNTKITYDIVDKLISRPLEDNMFGMIDGILDNNPSMSFKIYNDLKLQGQEPVALLNALGTQFRFLFQVKHLNEKGFNNDDIAKELNVKSGRVFYALKKIGNHSKNDLLKIISELADLDMKIRTGELDRFQGIEIFLINNH